MDPTHAKVLESLEKEEGSLLDAGAGTGSLSNALKKKFKVSACDILPKNKFKGGVAYKKADLNSKWPYKDKSFDLVCCVEVIEHLENPWHMLREANRVLKRGGTLIITTPNIMNVFSRLNFLIRGRFFCFGPQEMRKHHHLNPIGWWELKLLFEETGFSVARVYANKLIGFNNIKKSAALLTNIFGGWFMTPKEPVLSRGEILVIKARKVK